MLQFNVHNGQWLIIVQKLIPLCCQKLWFWGWCKIPSCSFPIVALQSNIPNANIKHLQIPDYSFCCGCICRNNQVQEKIVQSLSVFLMAKIECKNGVFIYVLARFWSSIAGVVEEQIGEQWSHATWKLNTFTHMLGSETYVHVSWKGSINNDDMKDTTNDV